MPTERAGYEIMVRSLAVILRAWSPAGALWDCVRVGGDAICEKCHLEYRQHPELEPTFHLRCDGTILKT